jgi:putative hydrolase of the HAD superfamily
VVFDLDDTLYPEAAFVRSGFRAVARHAEQALDIPADQGFAELWGLFEAGVRGTTFNQWLAARGLDPAPHIPGLVRAYQRHRPDIEPLPEVPGLLRELRQRYGLGLVSDGAKDVQRAKLDALGLAPLLHAVVFSDELGREHWKPSPAPFLRVMELLDAPPDAGVYVADNPSKDFLGARRAGLRSIRLRLPDGVYAHLEPETPEHAPDLELDSGAGLAGLPGLLARLSHSQDRGNGV